jgi:hypothetical protein
MDHPPDLAMPSDFHVWKRLVRYLQRRREACCYPMATDNWHYPGTEGLVPRSDMHHLLCPCATYNIHARIKSQHQCLLPYLLKQLFTIYFADSSDVTLRPQLKTLHAQYCYSASILCRPLYVSTSCSGIHVLHTCRRRESVSCVFSVCVQQVS